MTTVLVVDDSKVDRLIAGGLLEKSERLTITYADNGAQALERMYRVMPDLVVTDMQMPEMDGLELVARVRVEFPQVPVVLITQHGSEQVAVEALERGAASYVPKAELAERLLNTVQQVLDISRAERGHRALLDYLEDAHLSFRLENDPELVAPMVDYVQQMLASTGLCDATERVRVGVALEEALLNALIHGNLEISNEQLQEYRAQLLEGSDMDPVEERQVLPPYSERKVHVRATITPEHAVFVIADEGPGFDVSTVPVPQDPESLEKGTGRGLLLIRSFMDEVSFNERGNELTMCKFRRTEEPEDEAEVNGPEDDGPVENEPADNA